MVPIVVIEITPLPSIRKISMKELKAIGLRLVKLVNSARYDNQPAQEALGQIEKYAKTINGKKYKFKINLQNIDPFNFYIASTLKGYNVSEQEKTIISKGIEARLANNIPIVALVPCYLKIFSNPL